MNLPKFAVDRPVTTTMVFFAIVLLGIVSLTRLPIDLFPEIEPPIISVITSYPGAGAEDVERNVTEVLERTLGTVSDLKQITSSSEDNVSLIMLEFDWGTNLDVATNDVRDQLEVARSELPDNVNFPMIFKFDTGLIPVVIGAFTAEESYFELRELIDDSVGDDVRRLSGVGTVIVGGGPEREIHVEIDPQKLEAYNISLSEVNQILMAENSNIPLGRLEMGLTDYNVRMPGEFTSVHEMNDIVITRMDGEVIYLRDIAEIKDTFKKVTQEVRVNGQQGVVFVVQKQSDANTVAVAQNTLEVIEASAENLPDDVSFNLLSDGSEFIMNSVRNMTSSIIAGAVFVVVVVLLFLRRLRATFIIASVIPLSLIGAFIYLDISGGSLNIITLSSLAIALGLVVDDAIVILENIATKIEGGSRVTEAAIYGTSEVGLAVFATTMTIVAVFLPLVFLTGMAGVLFSSLGALVTITVIVSTFTALTFVPMLSAKWLQSKEDQEKVDKKYERLTRPFKRGLDRLTRTYKWSLVRVLRYRKTTAFATLLTFISSLIIVPSLGTEFIPQTDNGQLSVVVEFDSGIRLSETMKTTIELEEWFEETYDEELLILQSDSGIEDEGSFMAAFGGEAGSNVVTFTMRFVSKTERDQSIFEIAEDVRQHVASIPGIYNYNVDDSGGGLGGGAPIEIQVRGNDLDTVMPLAYELASDIRGVPGARDVEVSVRPEKPEIVVRPDREKIAQLGLNSSTIATSLNAAIQGITTSKYREGGEEYDIRVQIPEEYRNSITELENLPIHTGLGAVVPLREVATIQEEYTSPQIERIDQERYVTISLGIFGRSLGEVQTDIDALLAGMSLPQNVNISYGGQVQDQAESFADLFMLLLLSIVLVYVVMAAQFENYRDPFIVMFSIPFSFTGVFLALLVTGKPLSIMAFLSAILLIGIVVKNAIVLVDYTNILKDRGLQLRTAIIEGSTNRLRPVLMTAATTMLAMLPLAISTGEGSESWQPLGIAVIGGLLFSTLITMYLVPVLYSFVKKEKVQF